MLLPIEQLIDPEEARQLGTLLKAQTWLDGRRTAGASAARVKSNLQLDETSELVITLSQRIRDVVRQHPLFMSAALPNRIFPPRFNCYQNGGHYGLHTDAAILTLPDGSMMRSDVSATLFLCDAEDYEGGELAIETRFGAQEVKMNAGDLILYPSTSLHEVRPVTRGQRIAAFFWIQSLVADISQRETLFELDQSIQILTSERGAADNEVRRLSAVYHNLMRQWSNP